MNTPAQDTKDLLPYLTERVGCSYLSDLRTAAWRGQLCEALGDTPAGDFPDEMWRDTFTYLTGRAAPVGGGDLCRDALLREMETPLPRNAP